MDISGRIGTKNGNKKKNSTKELIDRDTIYLQHSLKYLGVILELSNTFAVDI